MTFKYFISFDLFSVLVVDKQVPSRAIATLPTAYLYFENLPDDERSKCLGNFLSKSIE